LPDQKSLHNTCLESQIGCQNQDHQRPEKP
jgi:hypothetical protein